MKKHFLLRPLRELSLRQRIAHGLITFGLPIFLLDILFMEHTEGWVGNLLIALLGGIVAGICFALIEHAVFVSIKKDKHINR